MDWDDVRVFLAVARAQSLAAGSRAAGLDRSTVSRRITSLEGALGARLFLRTRGGLRLSRAGAALVAHAERMGKEARALEDVARDDVGRVAGRVRLATTEALAIMLIREGLLELARRHPGLEIELLGENRVVDLAAGEADLALRIAPVRQPSLRVRRVARLSFALFASESYIARRGRPKDARDLEGHEAIAYSSDLAALPESQWLAERTGPAGVRTVLSTSSATAVLTALVEGVGVAVLSGSWAERQLGLVRLFDVGSLPARSLWLASHPDGATRAAVRAVADRVATIAKRGEP